MATPPTPTVPTPAAPGAAARPPLLQGKSPFQITNIGKAERWIKMMVYGAPGVGKTTLFASAADVTTMGNVLFVDAESGEMTIDGNDRIKNPDKIQQIRVTQFAQVGEIHKFLLAHCRFRDMGNIEKLKELESKYTGVPVEEIDQPKIYKTVIIDSLTEIEQYCLYQLLGMDQTSIPADAESTDVAEWGEFRKLNQMMQLVVRAFRDLPMNVFFASAQSYTQDEQKRMHYGPSHTGKLSTQIQGFVDVVGYLVTGAMTEGMKVPPRRLYVQPVGKFNAKNRRSGFKESHIDNPTMTDIVKAFKMA